MTSCSRRLTDKPSHQAKDVDALLQRLAQNTSQVLCFPGNDGNVNCYLDMLGREPPPPVLAGGYVVGDEVFYLACGETLGDGGTLVYGGRGTVTGPGGGASVRR